MKDDNLLTVRVDTVNKGTLHSTILLAPRLLRLRLEKRGDRILWSYFDSILRSEKLSWFLTWDNPGVCLTPNLALWTPLFKAACNKQIEVMSIMWSSATLKREENPEDGNAWWQLSLNLDRHLLLLPGLQEGNSLLLLGIFLGFLGLHLLHHLLKLLLRRVVRTQQLCLFLKLEDLETLFLWRLAQDVKSMSRQPHLGWFSARQSSLVPAGWRSSAPEFHSSLSSLRASSSGCPPSREAGCIAEHSSCPWTLH